VSCAVGSSTKTTTDRSSCGIEAALVGHEETFVVNVTEANSAAVGITDARADSGRLLKERVDGVATHQPVTRFTKYEDLPELLTPEEARQFLGLGRTGIYEAIRTGRLASVRFGRLIRVPRSALQPPPARSGAAGER
jgi:excisionase family DNA binding protein